MNFTTWGLSGSLHTEKASQLPFAQDRLHHWIDALDVSCNRFRDDSEISRLNAAQGTVEVSATMVRALVAERIFVDYRPGCGIRVSPHFYTSDDDVVRFFEAVDRRLSSRALRLRSG